MTGYADYKLSTPVAKVYNALHPPSAAQPHRPVTPTPDQVTHVTHVTIGGD
jgi:hypothetical protein